MPDLQNFLDEMSNLQRRVFEDAMARISDASDWQSAIDQQNQRVTSTTIRELLTAHGSGSIPVVLGDDLIDTIRNAAEVSAASIVSTFNIALARTILEIGAAAPDADYRTYRSLLLGETASAVVPGAPNWAARRGLEKVVQIGMIETAVTVNLAIDLFYKNNPELDGLAELLPITAVCPICQAGVDKNPYANMRAAYRAGPWPAHIGCVHWVSLITPHLASDSSEVWHGE